VLDFHWSERVPEGLVKTLGSVDPPVDDWYMIGSSVRELVKPSVAVGWVAVATQTA
jgi:hypothetical protein